MCVHRMVVYTSEFHESNYFQQKNCMKIKYLENFLLIFSDERRSIHICANERLKYLCNYIIIIKIWMLSFWMKNGHCPSFTQTLKLVNNTYTGVTGIAHTFLVFVHFILNILTFGCECFGSITQTATKCRSPSSEFFFEDTLPPPPP